MKNQLRIIFMMGLLGSMGLHGAAYRQDQPQALWQSYQNGLLFTADRERSVEQAVLLLQTIQGDELKECVATDLCAFAFQQQRTPLLTQALQAIVECAPHSNARLYALFALIRDNIGQAGDYLGDLSQQLAEHGIISDHYKYRVAINPLYDHLHPAVLTEYKQCRIAQDTSGKLAERYSRLVTLEQIEEAYNRYRASKPWDDEYTQSLINIAENYKGTDAAVRSMLGLIDHFKHEYPDAALFYLNVLQRELRDRGVMLPVITAERKFIELPSDLRVQVGQLPNHESVYATSNFFGEDVSVAVIAFADKRVEDRAPSQALINKAVTANGSITYSRIIGARWYLAANLYALFVGGDRAYRASYDISENPTKIRQPRITHFSRTIETDYAAKADEVLGKLDIYHLFDRRIDTLVRNYALWSEYETCGIQRVMARVPGRITFNGWNKETRSVKKETRYGYFEYAFQDGICVHRFFSEHHRFKGDTQWLRDRLQPYVSREFSIEPHRLDQFLRELPGPQFIEPRSAQQLPKAAVSRASAAPATSAAGPAEDAIDRAHNFVLSHRVEIAQLEGKYREAVLKLIQEISEARKFPASLRNDQDVQARITKVQQTLEQILAMPK